MFGLTKREQRWKAEKHAAELLTSLAQTTIKAAADIRVAEAAAEQHSSKVEELTAQLEKVQLDALRFQTAVAELALYFTSSNSVPVDQATIKTTDFWRIVGPCILKGNP